MLPRTSCKARHLLIRGNRPTPNSPSQSLLRKSDLCSTRCIYCDIWKLALLVYSRQNQIPNTTSTSPSVSPQQQHSSYLTASSSAYQYSKALKSLESAHTLQRARLSSIISICTVEGAEESEGLRMAHDRCLSAVLELLRQERALQRQAQQHQQQQMMMLQRERESELMGWRQREMDRDGGYGYGYGYGYGCEYAAARSSMATHGDGRRGSNNVVSCAM